MVEIIRSGSDKWNEYIDLFKERSHLHYTSEYHILFERNQDGIAELFIYGEGSNLFALPYIKKEINELGLDDAVYDIKSVFGYTGPILIKHDASFINKALIEFHNYCQTNNIISELVRFNPVNNNHDFYRQTNYKIVNIKPYVLKYFSNEISTLKEEYHPRLRNYINKSEKNFSESIFFTKDKDKPKEFYSLYVKHMKILGAQDYYLFSDSYYDNLSALIEKNGYLVYAEYNNQMVAGLIFLSNGDVSYYHHGARNIDVMESNLLNKYLFHRAFISSVNDNQKIVLLGGGVSDGLDDNLLRFKLSFGGQVRPFYMGKMVHNKELYNHVVMQWENKFPHLKDLYALYIDKYRFTK